MVIGSSGTFSNGPLLPVGTLRIFSTTSMPEVASRDGNGYAVFGKVTSGMDVVEKIRNVPTGNKGPFENVPLEPITIKQATLEK